MKKIIPIILFIVAITLVIVGQRFIGPMGLLTMLVGVGILIGLLYAYNKQYQ